MNCKQAAISNDITDGRYDVDFAISAKLSSAAPHCLCLCFRSAADLTEMSSRGKTCKYKINTDSLRLLRFCLHFKVIRCLQLNIVGFAWLCAFTFSQTIPDDQEDSCLSHIVIWKNYSLSRNSKHPRGIVFISNL